MAHPVALAVATRKEVGPLAGPASALNPANTSIAATSPGPGPGPARARWEMKPELLFYLPPGWPQHPSLNPVCTCIVQCSISYSVLSYLVTMCLCVYLCHT